MRDEQDIANVFKDAFAVENVQVFDAGIWDHLRVIRVDFIKDGQQVVCLYSEGASLKMEKLEAYAKKMAHLATMKTGTVQ